VAHRARRECIVFFVSFAAASLCHDDDARMWVRFMKLESDSRRVIRGLTVPRDLPHRATEFFTKQLFTLRADKGIYAANSSA
jgi:hypothetical protein